MPWVAVVFKVSYKPTCSALPFQPCQAGKPNHRLKLQPCGWLEYPFTIPSNVSVSPYEPTAAAVQTTGHLHRSRNWSARIVSDLGGNLRTEGFRPLAGLSAANKNFVQVFWQINFSRFTQHFGPIKDVSVTRCFLNFRTPSTVPSICFGLSN